MGHYWSELVDPDPCYNKPTLKPSDVKKEKPNYKREVEHLSKMLFEVCYFLGRDYYIPEEVEGLHEWWGKHKEEYEKRREKESTENKKKKALEKLTAEEKKLLGL